MVNTRDESTSLTVKQVFDEFLAVLHADKKIDNEAADRLHALLLNGKIPKSEEIDAVLFSPPLVSKP